jgi:hypothetical protein
MRISESRRRKQNQWRRAIVNMMLGLLAGILVWVIVLWTALQTE